MAISGQPIRKMQGIISDVAEVIRQSVTVMTRIVSDDFAISSITPTTVDGWTLEDVYP